MKKVVVLALLALFVAGATTSAFAWSFKMKGIGEWRFRYLTRTGNTDIFGTMNSDINLGANHLQTWPNDETQKEGWEDNPGGLPGGFGVVAGENSWGSDWSYVDYRVTLYPSIKVSKAIKFSAGVNMTSLGIWSDGRPLAAGPGTAPNLGYINTLYVPLETRAAAVDVPNTYVTVQYWKTSIKTPMLDFSIGYKNSGLGMGLWKHKKNRASASFGFKIKYGPLSIGFSPYWGRRNSDWDTSTNLGDNAAARKERIRNYFRAAMGGIKYSSGPLVMQLVSDSYIEEATLEPADRGAAILRNLADLPGEYNNADRLRYRIHASAKYFNGRFFANGEANWFNSWRTGADETDDPNTVDRDKDAVAWLYGAEIGTLIGPAKFTMNYVRATGNDPSTREVDEDARAGDSGCNDAYIGDWGYLMYHLYGTGTNFGANGFGFPSNFHHAGIRLDYAVAANLNIWGLYSRAWRDMPQATVWGGNYNDGRGGVFATAMDVFTNDDLAALQAAGVPNQAAAGTNEYPCPEHANDIGWEVNVGCDWKLLEHLTWRNKFAYWQPGSWWSYAYPNTAFLYQNNLGAAINAAVDGALARQGTGRGIDPLIAYETNILIDF